MQACLFICTCTHAACALIARPSTRWGRYIYIIIMWGVFLHRKETRGRWIQLAITTIRCPPAHILWATDSRSEAKPAAQYHDFLLQYGDIHFLSDTFISAHSIISATAEHTDELHVRSGFWLIADPEPEGLQNSFIGPCNQLENGLMCLYCYWWWPDTDLEQQLTIVIMID